MDVVTALALVTGGEEGIRRYQEEIPVSYFLGECSRSQAVSIPSLLQCILQTQTRVLFDYLKVNNHLLSGVGLLIGEQTRQRHAITVFSKIPKGTRK